MITCLTCRRTSKPVIVRLLKNPLIKCGLCNSTNTRPAREDEMAVAVKTNDVGLKIFSA